MNGIAARGKLDLKLSRFITSGISCEEISTGCVSAIALAFCALVEIPFLKLYDAVGKQFGFLRAKQLLAIVGLFDSKCVLIKYDMMLVIFDSIAI